MPKLSYEITRCGPGQKNLQSALNDVADKGGDIISVVPDYGAGAFGSTGARTQGYLIIVRRTA